MKAFEWQAIKLYNRCEEMEGKGAKSYDGGKGVKSYGGGEGDLLVRVPDSSPCPWSRLLCFRGSKPLWKSYCEGRISKW